MILVKPTTPIDVRLELYRGIAIVHATDPLVSALAAEVSDDHERRCRRAGGRECEPMAACVLRAVQARRLYRPDDPGPDQLWLPSEVLGARGGGDCEDLAVLVGSVARALGVPFRIVWLDRRETGNPQSHVTVQLGRRRLPPGSSGDLDLAWAEPCIYDAALGEHPLDAAARVKARIRERITGR